MARCAHTGLLLLCLSQFSRRSKLPRVVESLRVPSPGTRTAMMLSPSLWHINGYTWDPNGQLASQDQVWPDVMIVTAGVKHCFPAGDHRGVNRAGSEEFSPQGHCQPQDYLDGYKAAPESRSGSGKCREALHRTTPRCHQRAVGQRYRNVLAPIDL